MFLFLVRCCSWSLDYLARLRAHSSTAYIVSCCKTADPELDNVETQMVRYKPEGLDALCRLTKFTRKELQIMYRGFKQVRYLGLPIRERKCADAIGTLLVPWAGDFRC